MCEHRRRAVYSEERSPAMRTWPSFLVWAVCAASVRGEPEPCRVVKHTLDCSSRGIVTISAANWENEEVLMKNQYNNTVAVIPRDGTRASIEEVNLAANFLSTFPRKLSPRTKVLDVSRNRISRADDELRDLSVLEELRLGRNALTSLEFLPQPCKLLRLEASHNYITTLAGPLVNCTNIETLILKSNNITYLPEDTFSKMDKLKALDLSSNRLSPLSDGLFEGLKVLQHLDLSSTGIRSESFGAFRFLPLLESLDLGFNEISSLPDSAFAKLTSLRILRLSHNMIESFSHASFADLGKLERLDVSYNGLKTLPQHALVGCLSLRHLSLASNELAALPADAFAGMSSLKELELGGNKLSDLPANIFSSTVALQKLDLSRNALTRPPVEALSDAADLEELDVSFNNITELKARAFHTLPTLRRLALSGNPLHRLPVEALSGLGALQRLSLGRTGLAVIPEGLFAGLTSLEWLSLDHNDLSQLADGAVAGLRRLHTLDVAFNRLASLPSGAALAELRALAFLRATGNRLTSLPRLPTGCCAALRDASFWFNKLSAPDAETLRGWLGDGAALRYVNLRANPLRAEALRWALGEEGVAAVAESRSGDRACGSLVRGRARLRFCVDVPPRGEGGDEFEDWMDAARIADADSLTGAVETTLRRAKRYHNMRFCFWEQ